MILEDLVVSEDFVILEDFVVLEGTTGCFWRIYARDVRLVQVGLAAVNYHGRRGGFGSVDGFGMVPMDFGRFDDFGRVCDSGRKAPMDFGGFDDFGTDDWTVLMSLRRF